MACRIELIDFNQNKSIKVQTIDSSYMEAIEIVDELNENINTENLSWVVTYINI